MIFSLIRGGAMKMGSKIKQSARARLEGGEAAQGASKVQGIGHKALASLKVRRKGRAVAGFTLTELLVSILVLTVGCMTVISMQISGMSAGARANNLAVATFLAEAQAEWLQTMEVNKVSSVSKEPEKLARDASPCDENAAPGLCFTRTTKTACYTPTTRSCEVAIVVEWQGTDGPQRLIYDTVVSDFGF
jgi:type II secretory pathway pseudopilin PulG